MALDNAKNFAQVTVSTGYDAVATSILLNAGDGAKLPMAPFNVAWWNVTDYLNATDDPNKEIVRVTNIATDTLTVTRAQEGTSASTKNTANKSYKMVAALTAKVLNTDFLATNLVDYASGSWTPSDASGAGLTFTLPSGSYVKIGKIVLAIGTLTYPATASGATALIGGLPFASNAARAVSAVTSNSTQMPMIALMVASSTTFNIITASAAQALVTNAQMSTFNIFFSFVYIIP